MSAMTTTDIEVDLDRAPALTEAPKVSWLDQPKLVAGVVAAVGIVLIAAAATIIPALTSKPAPTVSAAAPACAEPALTPPLPAVAITGPMAANIPAYQDTGTWTWQQMLMLPADVGTEPSRQLLQLQTGSTSAPTVDVQTAGDQLLVAKAAGRELTVQFPAESFGGWVELRISSTNSLDGDLLAMTIVSSGGRSSQMLQLADDAHGALTGFSLSTPLGKTADVQHGPPSVTTVRPAC